MRVCRGVCRCWCHILQIAVSHGVKVFWMGPSHLVTIAETDRGAMGQSGVGVLNELSQIQTASVSRGMDEWPDSLSTSLFLSDFPALSLPSASHFGYPFLPSSLLSLPLSFTPSSLSALCTFSLFSHFHSKLFESSFFFLPQQWAALSELQPCFHSERRST